MNIVKANLHRYEGIILCLFLLFSLFPVSATAKETKAKEVRVGWYEDSYNITGENGERSGYGYEYQQSVAAYTGWKYKYVKAGWSDLLKMMQKGELDLMSGVSYTEERAKTMLFSELPMGEEKYYLYADITNTDISASNLKSLNDKRVGLLEGSIHATQFYKWEKKQKLHLQYVSINGLEDAMEKLKNHKIDCVVSAETPQLVDAGLSAIAVTGGSDIYFVVNKKRPDIKEELDNAMRKIQNDRPFYADELYQRYLSAVSSPLLSKEEKNWVNKHGAIRIGWLNNDAGVSNFNQRTKEFSGVLTDYIQLATDCLSNQTLQFDLVGFKSQEEQMQALKDGKIDMIFHFGQNPYVAEQNGFILSNTVLSANMAAVIPKKYFDENAENTVAIEKGNLLFKWYISYNYPKWKVVEYNSSKAVEKAVRDGKADCFITESGQLTKYTEDNDLHSVYLTQMAKSSFAVRQEDTILVSVLNKTLKTMPSSMLNGALSTYDSTLKKVTVMDFVKENLLIIAAICIAVFLLILIIIF